MQKKAFPVSQERKKYDNLIAFKASALAMNISLWAGPDLTWITSQVPPFQAVAQFIFSSVGGHILLLQQSQEQPVQKVLSGKCMVIFKFVKCILESYCPWKLTSLGHFLSLLPWKISFFGICFFYQWLQKKKKKKERSIITDSLSTDHNQQFPWLFVTTGHCLGTSVSSLVSWKKNTNTS